MPVGTQAGRVIKLGGKLPVKLEAGAYYNALREPGAGNWQLLTEVALVCRSCRPISRPAMEDLALFGENCPSFGREELTHRWRKT